MRSIEEIEILTDNDVVSIAEKEVARNDFELLHVRKLQGEENDYLRVVMAYSEAKKEYATWLLNLEMGGLHQGNYYGYHFMEKEKAHEWALRNYKIRN